MDVDIDNEEKEATTTPERNDRARVRVSPYPERVRTAPRHAPPPAPALYQIVVQPIVKTSLGQRDNSGQQLEVFAASGATFHDILVKLWDKFSPHVKGRAVRTDNVWAIQEANINEWGKVMQFKSRRHLIDDARNERLWNSWLVSLRGDTVKLLIYEFGVSITKNSDHLAFRAACIDPLVTDRAGAVAESSLRDVVSQLQTRWGSQFQGEAVVWRMWANHISRNQDRTTWRAAIENPPPAVVLPLLQASDSRVEGHLAQLQASGRIALDCVNASIADIRQLRQHWETFGRRLEIVEHAQVARKETIEGFINNLPPPPLNQVIDPLPRMNNIDDAEHQE